VKISGFTIARNAVKFGYPIIESIMSILPLCDEFIVNVGDSDDDTLGLIRSIESPKIRVIENKWDFSKGKEVLSHQTTLALQECKGDWAFYLQSDEVIHEDDLPRLRQCMQKYLGHPDIDTLRFQWLHFYGSYFRYRIDRGWYQKQDRIVRNNGQMESEGDAWGFRRKDGKPLRRESTRCFVYHYGWVQDPDIMARRRVNAEQIGFVRLEENEREKEYNYGDLNRFPIYFGSHPEVMSGRVARHPLSREDRRAIDSKFWWYPPNFLKIRYKTGRREKIKIEN